MRNTSITVSIAGGHTAWSSQRNPHKIRIFMALGSVGIARKSILHRFLSFAFPLCFSLVRAGTLRIIGKTNKVRHGREETGWSASVGTRSGSLRLPCEANSRAVDQNRFAIYRLKISVIFSISLLRPGL